jgi:hypothetical protein
MSIYLRDDQIRLLFLNKYLESNKFITKRPKEYCSSLEFLKGEKPILLNKREIVFLSQFKQAEIKSDNEKNTFYCNYNIPECFLKSEKNVTNFQRDIFDEEKNEFNNNKQFLFIRRALINSFIASFNGDEIDLDNWFLFINSKEKLSFLIEIILPEIVEQKDFPQVEMTAKFSKKTKTELQFFHFGRILGRVYFKENDDKMDDIHRDWLMNLNPEKDVYIGNIPEKFKEDIAIIIAYVLTLKFSIYTSEINIDYAKEILKNIDKGVIFEIKNEILFYIFFWTGLLNPEFDNYFHTNTSAKIICYIDKKSYQFTNKTTTLISAIFTDDEIKKYKQLKKKNITEKSKVFKDYCKMLYGDIHHETEKQIMEEIKSNNIYFESNNPFSKEVLIVFFENESLISSLEKRSNQLLSIKNSLLVYEFIQTTKDYTLNNEHFIGSIKKQLEERYPKIQFEIITKNTHDMDDREIKNNLKAYMRRYCTKSNYLYFINTKTIENRYVIWIRESFYIIPKFSKDENYLFIS